MIEVAYEEILLEIRPMTWANHSTARSSHLYRECRRSWETAGLTMGQTRFEDSRFFEFERRCYFLMELGPVYHSKWHRSLGLEIKEVWGHRLRFCPMHPSSQL